MRMLLSTVKVRPHRFATGQFINGRRVPLDFGESCARRETELFGKNFKDTGETDQRREFRDRARRKVFEIDFAFGRGRHAAQI
jgi:hypothetical protein